MLQSNAAKTAGLVFGLALGALGALALTGSAQAAPGGGGICLVDHLYHNATTYQVPECACPSGAIKHHQGNGDYSCSYPQRQLPARMDPRADCRRGGGPEVAGGDARVRRDPNSRRPV